MISREAILEDEFVRPPFPGLRIFSTGVLKLARKLELSFSLPVEERRSLSEEEATMEHLAMTWLLDARNDLPAIKQAASDGRERLFALLEDYQFGLNPALVTYAQAEMALTNAAVEQALYKVQAKPGSPADPKTPGKS